MFAGHKKRLGGPWIRRNLDTHCISEEKLCLTVVFGETTHEYDLLTLFNLINK